MTLPLPCVRFVPSHVEGLPGVTEAAVFPDRLELTTAHGQVRYPFAAMARWPRPAWLWRRLFRLGLRPRWLPVADRDWFHPPPGRFFAFYTTPPVTVFMPADDVPSPYGETCFFRVQQAIHAGGYSTFDLG